MIGGRLWSFLVRTGDFKRGMIPTSRTCFLCENSQDAPAPGTTLTDEYDQASLRGFDFFLRLANGDGMFFIHTFCLERVKELLGGNEMWRVNPWKEDDFERDGERILYRILSKAGEEFLRTKFPDQKIQGRCIKVKDTETFERAAKECGIRIRVAQD